jgi:SAM-dependent methyltransferase
MGAIALLIREFWEFIRDSTPERRRQRYGDMEYDWEHRVDTTSGSVGWRERLLGIFLSAYQPTDPGAFAEMMASMPIDFHQFTFVDLGSGKGRTLLMAAEYPFRRIVGVEILPVLHRVAEENVRAYLERTANVRFAATGEQRGSTETPHAASLAASDSQIDCVCSDARDYEFPLEPLVLYLFNPISQAGLVRVVTNLERSLRVHPRDVYILYHNPLLEHVLAENGVFKRIGGTHQSAIYRNTR